MKKSAFLIISYDSRMGFMDWNVGVMPLGVIHSTARNMLSQSFSPSNLVQYNDIRQQEVNIFLQGLLESPNSFFLHVRRYINIFLLWERSFNYVIGCLQAFSFEYSLGLRQIAKITNLKWTSLSS